MLLDRVDFSLNGEYVDRITDPDDPEVKAEFERRRRHGIKPPPVPLLTPIALRPEPIHSIRSDNVAALREQFTQPATGRASARGGRERVDIAGFEALHAAQSRAASP